MGELTIQEYERAANADYGASIQVGQEPAIAEQVVNIEAGETFSKPFHAKTRLVTLSTDAICKIDVDVTPSIKASSRRLPADLIGYPLGVPNDKLLSIAVKQVS